MKRIGLFRVVYFHLTVFLTWMGISFHLNSYGETTAKIVDIAGFEYDYQKNIYMTKKTALQRFFGFNRGYDYMATVLSMVIDAEPIPFLYNGKWYMIELWKGQYYASTGGEIGIYHQNKLISEHWDSATDEQMLKMAFVLKKNGEEVFSREGVHWWLTGFKPGVFSEPNELSLENIKIEFNQPGMGEAFYKALIEYFTPALAQSEYNVKFVAPNTVTFRWAIPRKPQDHLEKRRIYQVKNRMSAKALYLIMNPDYSPENFDRKMDELKKFLKYTGIDVDNIHGFLKPR